MTDLGDRRATARAWHVLQAKPHYCVPACTSMVGRARGMPIDHKKLATRWSGSKRGFALSDAAVEVSGQHWRLDPTDPVIVGAFREYLDDGALVIMQVFSAVIDAISGRFTPAPVSPHGRLCDGPYGGLHAVVLIEYDEVGFVYLDPYFEPAEQPFTMTRIELVQAFQGEIVVA